MNILLKKEEKPEIEIKYLTNKMDQQHATSVITAKKQVLPVNRQKNEKKRRSYEFMQKFEQKAQKKANFVRLSA